ncbi:hypothetical protein NQZ68_018620, partial [Dissostichus eleginoides]
MEDPSWWFGQLPKCGTDSGSRDMSLSKWLTLMNACKGYAAAVTLRERGGESGMREERRVRRDEGREINREGHSIFIDKEGPQSQGQAEQTAFSRHSRIKLSVRQLPRRAVPRYSPFCPICTTVMLLSSLASPPVVPSAPSAATLPSTLEITIPSGVA